jgi:hypothetical protein
VKPLPFKRLVIELRLLKILQAKSTYRIPTCDSGMDDESSAQVTLASATFPMWSVSFTLYEVNCKCELELASVH